jgi:hypothetical protein
MGIATAPEMPPLGVDTWPTGARDWRTAGYPAWLCGVAQMYAICDRRGSGLGSPPFYGGDRGRWEYPAQSSGFPAHLTDATSTLG